MLLNADFSKPAVLPAADQEWIHSPESGVDRIMLDRIGDEVARATSIVRYRPGRSFPRHEHAMGEEFLVLEGIFSDEHGDYPSGTYVRNPPGSGHSPFSRDGCRILVKLRQFDRQDLRPVAIDSNDQRLWSPDESGQTSSLVLHEYGTERVQMMRLQEACDFNCAVGNGGIELFVVSGSVNFDGQELPDDSWLRLPAGTNLRFRANRAATLWIKSGHLPETSGT